MGIINEIGALALRATRPIAEALRTTSPEVRDIMLGVAARRVSTIGEMAVAAREVQPALRGAQRAGVLLDVAAAGSRPGAHMLPEARYAAEEALAEMRLLREMPFASSSASASRLLKYAGGAESPWAAQRLAEGALTQLDDIAGSSLRMASNAHAIAASSRHGVQLLKHADSMPRNVADLFHTNAHALRHPT